MGNQKQAVDNYDRTTSTVLKLKNSANPRQYGTQEAPKNSVTGKLELIVVCYPNCWELPECTRTVWNYLNVLRGVVFKRVCLDSSESTWYSVS